MCWWYPLVEARCDSVVDVVKGSCGGVFGFEAVLCMMLLVMYGRRAFSRVFEITESSEIVLFIKVVNKKKK